MAKGFASRFSELYSATRFRARRRHSLWNLILIPLSLAGWLGSWYGLFRLVWAFNVWLYPDHLFSNFWTEGISISGFALSFLMLFAPAPGALCLGLVIANCVSWLLPPARRVFDAEAAGYPGTSFGESNKALLDLALRLVPTGLVVALIAAALLKSLR
jgi:hypothetical protein